MAFRIVCRISFLFTFGIFSCTQIAAGADRAVSKSTLQQLTTLSPGASLTLDAFPAGPEQTATIRFRRVQIYSDDAQMYAITPAGEQKIPRSRLIFLRGRSDDTSVRVAMSLNPDGSFASGDGSSAVGSFLLKGRVDKKGTLTLASQPLKSALPSENAFEFTCANDNIKMKVHSLGANAVGDLGERLRLAARIAASSPTTTASQLRTATIAIDTDSLFMSRLFGNDTTKATNWIAGMFNSMNTMYENDLQVELLIGTTILRTSSASDPYTAMQPSGTSSTTMSTNLNIFGNYWKSNNASVSRSFAMLLSGQIASTSNSCSSSGIAWLDQYCQKGFSNGGNTVGSYSVTQVCTSINIDPNGVFDSRVVGHEIGHNFGASHTHCTNISNGSAPAANNTIDQCFNQESASGCYAGVTSCPAAGHGSIMSYCNFTSVSGCAGGTQNALQFHPTQINDVLLPDIANHTPSCLSNDQIFADGFQ